MKQKPSQDRLPPKAKKRFGQHFLNSPGHLRAIVDAAKVQKEENVVEIGPGKGSLTRELLSRGARVTSIEKDRDLIPLLRETFADEIKAGRLVLIESDVLDLSPKDLPEGSYKLVANIPYYITGAILRQFLTLKRQPSSMTLLVQKEVAERIARSRKESLLSLSIKAFGTPSYAKTVPRGAFAPMPSVDSAILVVSGISRRRFRTKKEEDLFFSILHLGFRGKRKQLRGLLAVEFSLGNVEAAFDRLSIRRDARGEDLVIGEWISLARELSRTDQKMLVPISVMRKPGRGTGTTA